MSKVIHAFARFDPIANAISSGSIKGLVDPNATKKADAAKAQAATLAAANTQAAAGKAPGKAVAEDVKGMQVATRKEDLRAAAGAAGAKYMASDYDLLGKSHFAPKRRQASQDLLGS